MIQSLMYEKNHNILSKPELILNIEQFFWKIIAWGFRGFFVK